jgi:hypothetical protein
VKSYIDRFHRVIKIVQEGFAFLNTPQKVIKKLIKSSRTQYIEKIHVPAILRPLSGELSVDDTEIKAYVIESDVARVVTVFVRGKIFVWYKSSSYRLAEKFSHDK